MLCLLHVLFEDSAPRKLEITILIVAMIEIKGEILLCKSITKEMFLAMSKPKAKGIFVAASKHKAMEISNHKAKVIFVATSKQEAINVSKSEIILSGDFH